MRTKNTSIFGYLDIWIFGYLDAPGDIRRTSGASISSLVRHVRSCAEFVAPR